MQFLGGVINCCESVPGETPPMIKDILSFYVEHGPHNVDKSSINVKAKKNTDFNKFNIFCSIFSYIGYDCTDITLFISSNLAE